MYIYFLEDGVLANQLGNLSNAFKYVNALLVSMNRKLVMSQLKLRRLHFKILDDLRSSSIYSK